jgi:hypothetical protein
VYGGEGETIPMPEELPWWEAPEVPDEDAPPYALPPSLASEGITRDIKPPEGTGVKLAYNALAIWSVASRPIAPVWMYTDGSAWRISTRYCHSDYHRSLEPTSILKRSAPTRSRRSWGKWCLSSWNQGRQCGTNPRETLGQQCGKRLGAN